MKGNIHMSLDAKGINCSQKIILYIFHKRLTYHIHVIKPELKQSPMQVLIA